MLSVRFGYHSYDARIYQLHHFLTDVFTDIPHPLLVLDQRSVGENRWLWILVVEILCYLEAIGNNRLIWSIDHVDNCGNGMARIIFAGFGGADILQF